MLWAVASLFILGLLALTHDIIITNILAWQICRADPNPKTFIKKTVEFPESIYWEDNIYPGFDEKDRLLMIRNYLDGVHLKTMALNAPDGTIYLFTATPDDWKTSSTMVKETKEDWEKFFKIIEGEAQAIASRAQTYSKKNLPKLNYIVSFNPVKLTLFQSRYLYSDEASITESLSNKVIAFNRRLMHRWYLLVPDFVGKGFYYPEAICGESGYFIEGSVFNYAKQFHGQITTHVKSINFIKFEKLVNNGGDK